MAQATVMSQLTAENRAAEVDGETFVYRRFGADETGAPPLLCLQHFRGNLDYWDPALVDRLAEGREVILLANRGVGASTGVVPDNVDDMARDALRFVDVLGLRCIDLLGFSLGGYVAQEIALLRPRLVRRLVLAGTAPRGAPGIHRWSDEVYALATPDVSNAEGFVKLFFSGSDESRAKGMEFLQRAYARSVDRDAQTDLATRDAQLAAHHPLGNPGSIEARAPGGDRPAGARRERRQRLDDAHREQPSPRRAPAQRPAAHLPRLGPRLSRPVPRALRRARHRLPRRRLAQLVSRRA